MNYAIPSSAIRTERIEDLITAAFEGMEKHAADATATELASAIFTMCLRVIEYLLNVNDVPSRERNIEVARTAVAQLYSLLPPPTSIN